MDYEENIEMTEKNKIQAYINTLMYLYGQKLKGVCPRCGKYIIIDGYRCFGCGYEEE